MAGKYLAEAGVSLHSVSVRDLTDPMAQVPLILFDTPFEAAIYLIMFNRHTTYIVESGVEPAEVIIRELNAGPVAFSFTAESPQHRDWSVRRLRGICDTLAR